MSQFDYQESYDRNLPHMQPPEATLFVTFRLHGSIPQTVLEEWLMEKKQLEAERLRREAIGRARLDPEVLAEEKLTFERRWFGKFEALLHGPVIGPAWLKDKRVASIVREALMHCDKQVYRLDAFCIMPNHVHAVFAPLLTEEMARGMTQTDSLRYPSALAVIMHSLKGYTARKCNLVLGRNGAFWQHESFDHVIRNRSEFARVANYVLNNPVKAGMVTHWRDWQWNYCREW